MIDKKANTDYPIIELLSERWSPRAFNGKAIPEPDILSLFEAARWAPSASNEQPWSFILGVKQDVTYQKIFESLVEFNQLWCKTAPVLVAAVGDSRSGKNPGKTNAYCEYDLGQAVAHLSIEAMSRGIYVHQMAGFDKEQLAEAISVPDGQKLLVVFAAGYPGDPKQLHPNLEKLEYQERSRKSLKDFVFEGRFGHIAKIVS